jgi:hypothetical protein
MTNFLLSFGGTLSGGYPWSCNLKASSADSEASCATAWDTAVLAMWEHAALAAYFPSDCVLTYTSVSTASGAWKQTTKTEIGHNIAGTSSSQSLPPHVSEVFTIRTALATRYGRGRIYLPCMAENALAADGGTMLAAAQTALQGGLNLLMSAIHGTITLLILHRLGGGSGARAPLSTDPVISADVADGFVTQRRRADKRVPARVTVTV